jgi:hypothetical protein
VTTKENVAQVVLRNVISKVSFKLEVDCTVNNSLKSNEENYTELEKLLITNNKPNISTKTDSKIKFTPEYVISLLPESIQRRFNERICSWNPINLTLRIKDLIRTLDNHSVYSPHTISILYFNKNSKLNLGKGLERFIRFLAKLGTVIDIKEVSASCFVDDIAKYGSEMAYGFLWRNELTQVFLLCKYINEV